MTLTRQRFAGAFVWLTSEGRWTAQVSGLVFDAATHWELLELIKELR
jgi:hypothetical protein